MTDANNSEVSRFDLNVRVQHILLFTCLIILSLTGLALRFHNNLFAKALIALEGGVERRGLIHRGAAIVLILLSLYHLFYVLLTDKGHEELMKIKPRLKDFRDFWMTLKFNLGISHEGPEFDKFDFRQKFQYAGVVVGSGTMIISGLLLWFETQSMAVLPKWLIDITWIIHGSQAVLAFIVLFLWHLYNVHFNPEVFPMDRTWITGKISLKRLKEKHPIEYRRFLGREV